MYTKLPTLTTFVHGVMWACIMQSRDYMYIQVLVLLVGAIGIRCVSVLLEIP